MFNGNAIDLSIWSILCANKFTNWEIPRTHVHTHARLSRKVTRCSVCLVCTHDVCDRLRCRNKETRAAFLPYSFQDLFVHQHLSLSLSRCVFLSTLRFVHFSLRALCVNQKKAPFTGTNKMCVLICWYNRPVENWLYKNKLYLMPMCPMHACISINGDM